jgi:hypothetical protein
LSCGNPNSRPIASLRTVYLVEFGSHKDAIKYPNPWSHFRVTPLIEKYNITLEAITSIRFITAHAIRAHIPKDIAVIDQVLMAIGCSDAVIQKLTEE